MRHGYEKFPVGPAWPVQRYIQLPVDRNGRPVKKSAVWKAMIADAARRDPEQRSVAETSALRAEMSAGRAFAARIESAAALGTRAASMGYRAKDNPFLTGIFRDTWEKARLAALEDET